MPVFEHLLKSGAGSSLVGLCIGLSFFVSLVSVGLYFVYRQRLMLHFGFGTLALYWAMAVASADPRAIPTRSVLFYVTEFFGALYIFFWYMVSSELHSENETTASRLSVIALRIAVVFNLAFLFVQLLTTEPLVTRVFAMLLTVFLVITLVTILFAKPKTSGMKWFSVGWFLLTIARLPFAILRAGFLGQLVDPFIEYVPDIIVGSTSMFSIICLWGIIKEANQVRLVERLDYYGGIAKTFSGIRDQMNTPLQTLEFATEILKDDNDKETMKSAQLISDSLAHMKGLNKILSRYEAQMRWTVSTTHAE